MKKVISILARFLQKSNVSKNTTPVIPLPTTPKTLHQKLDHSLRYGYYSVDW